MCEVPQKILIDNSNYNLELFDDMTNNGGSLYCFKDYVSIVNILKYFNDKEGGDNKYQNMINHINQKLNENQKTILNQKYKPMAFDRLDRVSTEYPFYSLRNVYLKEWNFVAGEYKSYYAPYNDLARLNERYRQYMRAVTNRRYKYQSTRVKNIFRLKLVYIVGVVSVKVDMEEQK